MKKTFCLLLTILLLSVGIVSSGFAFFNFSDIHKINNIDTNFVNAKFNEINNDYYRIYFFASPYYATGADGIDSDDPLKIADSENNPYGYREDPYLVADNKTTVDTKYANIFFPNGSHYYYAAKEIDNKKLAEQGDGTRNVVTMFNKCDFTGFIRKNSVVGITQQEYSYVSMTIKGSISSSVLSNVIAGTEFKDRFGFGPEFVGWTFDKEATKKRTMYGNDRYPTLPSWSEIDDRGWGKNGVTPKIIGNYGFQGEIDQISENTSLSYLDNLASSSDSDVAIDGSKLNDHVIYLYPVFVAKNYSADKNIGGTTTSLIKFRVNPETDTSSADYYSHKQIGEIDYSKNRYTVGFFQTEDALGDDKISSETDLQLGVNYYTDGIYIDTSGEHRIKNMQIDIDLAKHSSGTQTTNDWGDVWSTILSYDKLKALNLELGYYNVDMSFTQYFNENKITEDESTAKITELVQKYKDTNKYIAVYGSRKTDDNSKYGMEWYQVNEAFPNSKSAVDYVIGFQKINEYHVTGNNINGSINDYSASGYKKIFITDIGNSHKQYYTIDRVYLTEGDEIAILDETCSSLNDTKFTLNGMNSTNMDKFNTALKNSNHSSKNPFSGLGTEAIIVDEETSAETKGNVLLSLSGNKKIVANASGNYSLVFTFDYVDGATSAIHVGYRKNKEDNTLLVLKEKPTEDVFINYDSLINSDNYFASHESDVFSILNLESTIYCNEDKNITTINDLFTYCENNNKKLIDTATGFEVTKEIFANRAFTLNRSFVLYFEDVK